MCNIPVSERLNWPGFMIWRKQKHKLTARHPNLTHSLKKKEKKRVHLGETEFSIQVITDASILLSTWSKQKLFSIFWSYIGIRIHLVTRIPVASPTSLDSEQVRLLVPPSDKILHLVPPSDILKLDSETRTSLLLPHQCSFSHFCAGIKYMVYI